MRRIVGTRALFSNEFVFGFICLKSIWTGLRAAPLGFSGFAPGHKKIKALRHLQEAETSAFQRGLRQAPCFFWPCNGLPPNM
jgi:hypothetical protein